MLDYSVMFWINFGGLTEDVIGILIMLFNSVFSYEESAAVMSDGKFIFRRSRYLDFRTDSEIKVDLLESTLAV